MTDIKIHFVGRKDSFRGRLAVAYANSLKVNGFVFTSSGIEAAHERIQAPDPEARELAKKSKCYDQFAKRKVQTTSALLKRQDIVIFMSKDVYDDAQKKLQFDARKCVLWQIDDLDTSHLRRRQAKATAAAKDWDKLARLIRLFLHELALTSWCDVYDEHNMALGYKLPVKWVDGRKGLWCRYVHAVVTTADNKYVVERQAGARLHLSMDGAVVAGETPRQAVQRHLQAKFGVRIRPEQAAFQNVKKYQGVVKTQDGYAYYTKYSNRFVYTYHVALTLENPIFLPGGGHGREILLLKRRALLRALKHPAPSMKRHLMYGRKHYAKAVKRAKTR
ncbi:MAG TPA: hypothetical protein VFL85_00390 [Candidatus Saccharimonadales bacterium]|nr:hypothetical protein [Candidatus Saccharimonadales bacterium]